jgi:hypothetical protein
MGEIWQQLTRILSGDYFISVEKNWKDITHIIFVLRMKRPWIKLPPLEHALRRAILNIYEKRGLKETNREIVYIYIYINKKME